jgi:hypothetical protein
MSTYLKSLIFKLEIIDRLVFFIVRAVSSKTKLLLSRTAEHHMKVKHSKFLSYQITAENFVGR